MDLNLYSDLPMSIGNQGDVYRPIQVRYYFCMTHTVEAPPFFVVVTHSCTGRLVDVKYITDLSSYFFPFTGLTFI